MKARHQAGKDDVLAHLAALRTGMTAKERAAYN